MQPVTTLGLTEIGESDFVQITLNTKRNLKGHIFAIHHDSESFILQVFSNSHPQKIFEFSTFHQIFLCLICQTEQGELVWINLFAIQNLECLLFSSQILILSTNTF